MHTHEVSQRLACRAVGISRSAYRYKPNTQRDDEVIAALQTAVERYPAYGFSKLFKILRRQGTVHSLFKSGTNECRRC